MELAMIGLGRIGGNMAHRLSDAGHTVVGWTRSGNDSLAKQYGISWAGTLEDAVAALEQRPRVVWLMIPAGAPTSEAVTQLTGLLEAGDIVVDGGNSNFRDSQQHAASWRSTASSSSTAVPPAACGLCERLLPDDGWKRRGGGNAGAAFETLAPPDGWLHTARSAPGTSRRSCTTASSTG